MKLCFLIQTYKNPQQIFRLVQTLKRSSPNCLIVISHNQAGCPLDLAQLQQFSDVHVLLTQGRRGNFSTVQNYLDAVAWLIKHNLPFDWFINLSGQDYPVRSLTDLEAFLAAANVDGFIEHFPVFSSESPWGRQEGHSRYRFRYRVISDAVPEAWKQPLKLVKLVNYVQPFFRVNFAYNFVVGVRTAAPFNPSFVCYGGSYFNTLSRPCIEYLHEFTQANPQIVEHYRWVSVPEESFVQTVLLNSKRFRLANQPLNYIDFTGCSHGRPRVLALADYEALVESQAFFARKFEDGNSPILDSLDQRVLQASWPVNTRV
jgi:hypothetical protein